MKKRIILIALSIILVASIGIFSLGLSGHSITYKAQAEKLNFANLTSSPCGCHNSKDVNKYFIIPSKSDSIMLVSIAKTQKIYKDYDKFLRSEEYVECPNAVFTGFFRTQKGLSKNTKQRYAFYYKTNLNVKKAFIAVIPYTNRIDRNKIAGIVLAYGNGHIVSYIIEVKNVKAPQSKPSVNMLLEDKNGEILNASQAEGTDSIIDWQCMQSCIPGALASCIGYIGTPVYPVCVAAAWGMCYDWCVLYP